MGELICDGSETWASAQQRTQRFAGDAVWPFDAVSYVTNATAVSYAYIVMAYVVMAYVVIADVAMNGHRNYYEVGNQRSAVWP